MLNGRIFLFCQSIEMRSSLLIHPVLSLSRYYLFSPVRQVFDVDRTREKKKNVKGPVD